MTRQRSKAATFPQAVPSALVAAMAALWFCGCAAPRTQLSTTQVDRDFRPRFACRKDCIEREARLRETLIDDPNNAAAWTELGQVLREQRKFHAADEAFACAVALDPKDSKCRLAYAEFLDGIGDGTRARQQILKTLRLDRKSAEAHALHGKLLRVEGQNSEALRELQWAWKANPPSTLAGVELAKWDLERGATSAAADKLSLCVARAPDDIATRRLYAKTLADLRRNNDAIREWESLAAKGEAGPDGTYLLAELYARQGMQDDAWNTYAEARRLAPKHPLIRSVGPVIADRTRRESRLQDYPDLVTSRR